MGISSPRGKHRLLVLGAGPAQLGLLRAARDRGLFVVACDRDPQAPGFEHADRRAIVSAEDEPAIGKLAEAEAVDGVIAPGIDWPVAIAARVAARFALPHPLSPETAALAVSKQRQRERLAEAGVPQPAWQLATEPDGLPVPCVVKPPDRQGQKGLTLVRDESELGAAVELAVRESRAGCALVEELVEGPEVTVNGFSVDGVFHPLTVTDRLTAELPAFGVALAHAWPSEHDVSEAVDAARAAAEALGIANGPTYTQVKLSGRGPKVMELAARLGGGHDAEVCREALAIDPNELALDAALGEPVEIPHAQPAGGACVRFLVPPEGELTAIAGIDEARAADGVVDAQVYRRPGYVFGPFLRGADRAGFVLATGASRDEALTNAGRAADSIRFEIADAALLQQT
ncbi:MAG TPA: ATP-grasp domain-containing protein [Gaiellaceae bacterium]|nr:ATP-grasp domain-containing protein [Gaiellaceae bacterium]